MSKKHKNMIMFIVEHGTPVALELSVEYYMEVYIQDSGKIEALEEAIDGHDIGPGVWIGELALVDDGPSDWPGARECRLSIKDVRKVSQEEWRIHASDEFIFPDPPEQKTEEMSELKTL